MMTFNWKQYTIRSALICVTIFAIFFAYVSSVIASLSVRSRNYDAIFFEHGAAIRYTQIEEHRWLHPFLPLTYDTTVESVSLFDAKHDGETLSALVTHINAFDSFRQLTIHQGASITDADLSSLCGLNNLKFLVLQGSSFSDAGLVHVARLNSLEQVSFRNTRITANGLQQLRDAMPYCVIGGDLRSPPVLDKPEPQTIENAP